MLGILHSLETASERLPSWQKLWRPRGNGPGRRNVHWSATASAYTLQGAGLDQTTAANLGQANHASIPAGRDRQLHPGTPNVTVTGCHQARSHTPQRGLTADGPDIDPLRPVVAGLHLGFGVLSAPSRARLEPLTIVINVQDSPVRVGGGADMRGRFFPADVVKICVWPCLASHRLAAMKTQRSCTSSRATEVHTPIQQSAVEHNLGPGRCGRTTFALMSLDCFSFRARGDGVGRRANVKSWNLAALPDKRRAGRYDK